MDYFLFLLLLFVLKDAKVCIKGNKEYLAKEQTNAIKGIFILFVLFRHFKQYASGFSELDKRILFVNDYFDQLIVVMFLFYSGYGVFYSMKNKGKEYIQKFPQHRILPVLLQFMAIVLVYYCVGFAIGKSYSLKRLAASLIGWQSVGNSNWYIFSILMLYLFTYLAALIGRKKEILFWFCSFAMMVVFVAILCRFKEDYWYNTLGVYFFGMVYGRFEKQITKIFCNPLVYGIGFIICTGIYHITRTYSSVLVCYQFMSITFAFLIVMITMRVQIGNRYLLFWGENLFAAYMLQRLPMMVLQPYRVGGSPVVYFLYVITFTTLLVIAYSKIMKCVKGKKQRNST